MEQRPPAFALKRQRLPTTESTLRYPYTAAGVALLAQVLPLLGTHTAQAVPASESDEPVLVSVATTSLVLVDQAQLAELFEYAASPSSRKRAEEPMALKVVCACELA